MMLDGSFRREEVAKQSARLSAKLCPQKQELKDTERVKASGWAYPLCVESF